MLLRFTLETFGSQHGYSQRVNTRSSRMILCHTFMPVSILLSLSMYASYSPTLFLELYCVYISRNGNLAHFKEKSALCFSSRCVCVYTQTSLSDTISNKTGLEVERFPLVFHHRTTAHDDRHIALFEAWADSVGLHTATVA